MKVSKVQLHLLCISNPWDLEEFEWNKEMTAASQVVTIL